MAENEGYRKYFEAAAVLGQITRARAEELVRELMSGGDMQRAQAQQWVDDLIERSRKATEDLVDLVRSEVANQMNNLGLDSDDLARQAAEILRRSAAAGRRVVHDMAPADGASGSAARSSAGSAARATKKAGGGKKSGAKKTGIKKAASPTSGSAPGSTKKASPKKASPKKASPKKASPKKASPKKASPKKASTSKTSASSKKSSGAKKASGGKASSGRAR